MVLDIVRRGSSHYPEHSAPVLDTFFYLCSVPIFDPSFMTTGIIDRLQDVEAYS